MAEGTKVTLLHLSDLHFGRKHRFEREGLSSLLSRVCEDLDGYAVSAGLRPDVVVLSGDFAELGKREEFEHASTFVRGLRAHLGLPARRVVMVPGNHDINWNKSRAYFEDREGDGLPAEEPYFPKLVHYKRFFDALYAGEEGLAFTEEEPWSFFDLPDLGVVIAGLNSAFAESHRPEDHHAFLGERQIRAFAGKLRPYKERGALRIGVMHHDPFDKRGGPKADQDQRDFRQWLVPELNLLLHGDIHEETCRYLTREVPALSVGSAAVGVDERGPDVSNEYQLLVVRSDGVERHLRAWVSDQKRWVASPRSDSGGESGTTFVRADFEAIAALGRAAAPAPEVDLPAIVSRYRAVVTRRQGAPTVFDLLRVGESEESGGQDFLRLFVPQLAVRDVGLAERLEKESWRRARGAEGEGALELDRASNGDGEPEDRARSLFDWPFERARTVDELFDQPRLIFLGAPGAGKSALTRWLLLKLCVPGERVQGLTDEVVPVRLELRGFDQEHRRFGQGYTVFDHVAREQADLHGPLTADGLRRLADQGRVLWLFDGLDEIVEPARRRDMADRIAGILDDHKDCRAVVTSRAAGVDVARPLLEGAGFQTYAIQDFTEEQRDRFLDAWHELMFRRDPATGAQRRARMGAAIQAAPSLQELCKSPLLCSMLAYLHREEALPRRRHLLYQKVLERMAEHWDANKGLPARPAAERFELEDKLAFLRSLAWQMQSEARTAGNTIGRSELTDFAAAFCEARWGQPKSAARRRAEALIDQLYARSGVLAYLGGDVYGFAHRAFLEHLAASEMVERFRTHRWGEEDLGKVFAEHYRDGAWEETLLLACGLLQEDREIGCARVVRLLQGMGVGRVAEICDAPDEFLIFSIKALAELPQLKEGVAGDFARAINEVLIVRIREGSSGFPYALAFRRCAGRWPAVSTLLRTTIDPGPNAKRSWFRWSFYAACAAAGGKAHRAEILVEALRSKSIVEGLFAAREEATRSGRWSTDEINAVLEACSHQHEEIQLSVVTSIVPTPGSRWSDKDAPISLLWTLMQGAATQRVRVQSAAILLRASVHVDAAKAVLLSALDSSDDFISKLAILSLADQFGALVGEALARLARKDGSALVELVKLAQHFPPARDLLVQTLAAIRSAEDPDVLLEAAYETMRAGMFVFDEEEILAQFRRYEHPALARGAMRSFLLIPGAERLVLRGWLWLVSEGPEFVDGIESDSDYFDPARAGDLLHELWKRVFELGRLDIAIPIARRIFDLRLGGPLEARARQLRDEALGVMMSEQIRLQAARSFREVYPVAQEVLRNLARNAQNEGVRFTAARLVGDLSSMNDLAVQTHDEHLREEIRQTLDLYGEINSLLQVGRLRRARVRLDGRDVGVLEELTRVGNGTRFLYNPGYDGPPIAPNMPVGQTYESTESLLPFFANLLPEGALYEQTARRLGLKRNDRFGVLLRVGADTMGAIEVLPMEPA
jgi:HipA-like protein